MSARTQSGLQAALAALRSVHTCCFETLVPAADVLTAVVKLSGRRHTSHAGET